MLREMGRTAAMHGPIRGFSVPRYEIYESPSARGGSALPKVIGVIVAVSLLRMVVSHRRGHGNGGHWRDRRREMIAELHRDLHRQEELAGDAPAPETGAKA